MAEAYNLYSVDDNYEDDEEEEVAVAEWNWGKKTVMVPNLREEKSRRIMTLMSQNRTSSLTSYLRRARSNCRTIMLCCPLNS